ncbi:MAG: nucleotidyltransferase domain-containing protein [Anaerolineae bacterium]
MNTSLDAHLGQSEQEAVRAFLDRVWTSCGTHILDVLLFGSKARGDSERDSDIDVLLIADTDAWQFKHTISGIASDIGVDYDVLIDARVIGIERWQHMAEEGFSLYQNIAHDGIPLPTAADVQMSSET